MIKRLSAAAFAAAAFAAAAFALSGCSGSSNGPPAPFVVNPTPTPLPSATATPVPSPSAVPSATTAPTVTPNATSSPTPAGSASPTSSSSPGGATPTPMPGQSATPTATPVATLAPSITASLTSIYVCTEVQMACPNDLDPNAASGEEAAVLVKGVLGSLTASNTGGSAKATVTTQVYANMGSDTEYLVSYKSATDTPTSDTLTISDAGSHSSVTIPVNIIDAGNDSGPGAFSLTIGQGTVCGGNFISFGTQMQGNAGITMTPSDASLISVSTSQGAGNFVDYLIHPGSSYVTAAAGTATVVYPANVPASGFTSSC